MDKRMITIDGNEATAMMAHKLSEVIAIYPITPSSPMGEHSDAWSSQGKTNIWGTVPFVQEMQSEGGASASVHGALQTGALTTTFTASQGLLLMIPSMYKIAAELTPTVFHVSARSLACQALSIFGDHSDVMGVRQTGFALMASGSIQEAMDLAVISHASTLKARIPFVHFFDGFRTSHEIQKIELVSDETLIAMMDDELVIAHRNRGLNPNKPVVRGTSQNPDVYFQGRETVNKYYVVTPGIVQYYMDRFADLTGRSYHIFDYVGAPDAERIIIQMGSGCETADATVDYLSAQGEKVGLLKVHLYRPFDGEAFLKAIPDTVKTIVVLDRTKEPGGPGEPLYMDVLTTLGEKGISSIRVIGGRYGLSSKEYTPAMVKTVLDEASKAEPKNHFTLGINDDVTGTSLDVLDFSLKIPGMIQAVFMGLGSDGTVGANKNSIKIIGEETDHYAQGYFVYDSKKAGALTVSHLRFGPKPIKLTCLVDQADFVACHQTLFMEKYDVLGFAADGGTFLLNTPFGQDEIWNYLPRIAQKHIIDKKLRFYVIDAYNVAKETGMGVRINTIMQTCFFAISGVLPSEEEAIQKIKDAIHKTYSKKGEDVVQQNYNAVDQTIANLFEVTYPDEVTSSVTMPPTVSENAPDFVRNVTATIIRMNGNDVPVSAMPADGSWPTGTTMWEKRNVAQDIPVWNPEVCLQCGICSFVCPHAAIRIKAYDPSLLDNAPSGFKSIDAKGPQFTGMKFTVQVAPEDCTGCMMCVNACPGKNREEPGKKAINMAYQPPLRAQEAENYDFFLDLPDFDRSKLNRATIKGSQLMKPLFEYSGACAGCGETPYVKLVSQLFGDRSVIANATGCSSIYGGNLPTTPYTFDLDGRGPAWNNSLFEDAAEFGFGFRLTADKHTTIAIELLKKLESSIGSDLVAAMLGSEQKDEHEISEQRIRLDQLRKILAGVESPDARLLESVADYLVRRSVWIFGGDGWAYDIGYGGLDHVLAQGLNVNVLVLDTGVYSNTGGQCSKATPLGAVAKFAASGKPVPKKDLGMICMAYGNIYVAQIAMGANYNQTVKALVEAETFDGPSIVICYTHCIAHGIDMTNGLEAQKLAVNSGFWPLFRFDPRRIDQGEKPLQLDSKPPSIPFKDFAYNEVRFKSLTKSKPEHAAELLVLAQEDVERRWRLYEQMAEMEWVKE